MPVRARIMDAAVPLALADDLKAGISTTENLMVPKRLALYPGAASPLAQFGMVCGMVFPVIMFPAAILFGLNELLIPELARCSAAESKARIDYLVRRGLRVAMLYGVLCCGIEFLLADSLCMRLYGSREAAAFLRRFSLMIPMLYCDAITDAMIKGLGQQKISVRYNILTNILDVTFLYILLPKYGMDGYFFSFFITHLLNFGLSLNRLLKITGKKIPLGIPGLTLLLMCVSIFAASSFSSPAGMMASYLGVLSSSLYLFKIIGKEDLLWLKGLIRKK